MTTSRTEIIRVRVRPEQKSKFAKCSAAIGLPSATHAYNLLVGAMHAHVTARQERRTGAVRRPVHFPNKASFAMVCKRRQV